LRVKKSRKLRINLQGNTGRISEENRLTDIIYKWIIYYYMKFINKI